MNISLKLVLYLLLSVLNDSVNAICINLHWQRHLIAIFKQLGLQ